jgi:transcriptional regulator with XRE-family HTH domain
MRLDLGLTLDEAARLLDKTRSALGRIEKGETIANVHLVRSAMDVYQTYDPDIIELAREAMQPGWWQPYGVRDRDFIGLETAAVRSREVALVRLPDLLQTADYTRELLSPTGSTWSRMQIEKECAVRSIRQQRLTEEHVPLELTVILDESALRRPLSDAAAMRRQLRHLVDMAEHEYVTVSVLPNAVGAHPGMVGHSPCSNSRTMPTRTPSTSDTSPVPCSSTRPTK